MRRLGVGDPAPSPLVASPEHELSAAWEAHSQPAVSIICATYQHSEFISDALNGFLGQVTDFAFEVLVRDDASDDGTAEIVADFAERYPGVVRAVLEPENTWPQQQAAFLLQPQSRGEFIAYCEGDDYWTDPHHLATLVAELRAHPEASAVYCPTVNIARGRITLRYEYKHGVHDPLLIPHFPGIPLGAICARNIPVPAPPMRHRIRALDRYHLSTWAKAGPILPVPHAAPSVYRLHEGGQWSPLTEKDRAALVVDSYIWIAEWWRDQGDDALAGEFERAAIRRLLNALPEAELIAFRCRFVFLRGVGAAILRHLSDLRRAICRHR